MTLAASHGSEQNAMRVVVVTGPSGAGRSTAINALEDLGFEAIDNLPLTLLPRLLSGPLMPRPLALGVDVRNRDFSAEGLAEVVEIMGTEAGFDATLVYLDCETDVLLRRFSETRRKHPLATKGTALDGIIQEKTLIDSLRLKADVLIDTSAMSPHDLRAELVDWFAPPDDGRMAISVQSFSYKRGMPRGPDMVLDCRFLKNPHWEASLRKLTGLDQQVGDYIATDPRLADFQTRTADLVLSLLPAYREEGKSYFTIAFGCTGGQHRSVFMAEWLANSLAEHDWQVSIRHRELERKQSDGSPLAQGRDI